MGTDTPEHQTPVHTTRNPTSLVQATSGFDTGDPPPGVPVGVGYRDAGCRIRASQPSSGLSLG